MASYFGEVILPSSRAFWNDDEDDDTFYRQDDTEFKSNWIESEPAEVEKLLVIEGEMIINYIYACLLQNAKVVCNIEYESEKNKTKIYFVDDIYICAISSKLNLAQAGKLTETISSLLRKCKAIYTFTSDHISHFKSEEEIYSTSILKSLYSSKARNNKNWKISVLNQPNIVTGVCAGVLSYAEMANLSCIMYILYTDTFTLDSKNASPLTDLLAEVIGKTFPSFTTGGSSFFNKGNLYL
ncbi:proteasome assembly chaperone 1-like isoform X5 [Phymastichus coffea]|uniref:proteasome assembly chaperone 1-like isoform X5 n=1 Tax=Phymastichus coffea TaxID=108790 RepID=UPI00273B01C7|nr:proteasome assembly chaperone 1-like isoform X5 [Phymastichus coffea]